MTYTVCYWDSESRIQKEREATPDEVAEIEARQNAALIPVYADLSPRQIRQALNHFSLRDAVEAAVAASDQNTKDWWQHATAFERNHPLVATMLPAIGATAAQADQVWAYGAAI